jgi:hypothetical protein
VPYLIKKSTELNLRRQITDALNELESSIGSGSVSDDVYGAGWNGDTTTAPSKNAVYDKIESLSGGVSDGDKGDITVSGSGATWTIDNQAVTLAKMASMATDSFIGRDTAGSGAPEVLSAATARSILNVADGANNYTHPNDGVDPGAALTGAVVFSDITVNAAGHVTGSATRSLTAADIGAGNATFLSGTITTTANSSSTVYATVTGSEVTVEAGKTYSIQWRLRTYSAANTTAPRPRRILGGGAAGTVAGFHYLGMSNATAGIMQSSREGTNDPFLATGNATSTTTAAGSQWIDCLFICTTGGTIGIEFVSEVNTSSATYDGDGSYWTAIARTT